MDWLSEDFRVIESDSRVWVGIWWLVNPDGLFPEHLSHRLRCQRHEGLRMTITDIARRRGKRHVLAKSDVILRYSLISPHTDISASSSPSISQASKKDSRGVVNFANAPTECVIAEIVLDGC